MSAQQTRPARRIHWGDRIFLGITLATTVFVLGILAALVWVLTRESWLSITTVGPGFVWGQYWYPNNYGIDRNTFGALPFIVDTLVTCSIALLLAVPLSLGISIFISEHAPEWLKQPFTQLVELLAAVPSVIFGFWGFFVLAPYMASTVDPGLQHAFPGNPLFSGTITGFGILTTGIILCIMIIPTVSTLSREAMVAVPQSQREAVLSLGATKWEATRIGVVKYARSGIFGAVILGLGRAVGETMAVVLTIGNGTAFPTSLFSTGSTMTSLIANQFSDTTSPLDKSALIEMALLLLVITVVINVGARLLMRQLVLKEGV